VAWSYDYQEHKFYHVPNNVPDLPLAIFQCKQQDRRSTARIITQLNTVECLAVCDLILTLI